MKYCSLCAGSIVLVVPELDDRERHVCDDCGHIHYHNPKVVVGCVPVYGDKVLLCRRAIEPRRNFWTLPAGFMENGESSAAGALRETWEEARARVEQPQLYTVFDLPHISQMYLFYLGQLSQPEYAPGPESLEVELFTEAQIPWRELAFPVVKDTLKHYFADRIKGEFPVRNMVIDFAPRRQGN